MRNVRLAILVTAILMVLGGAVYGGPNSRRQRNELRFDSALVPGDYYQGDHLGYNLSLSLRPDGNFAFTSSGCLGIYGKNAGTWKLLGDVVVLHPVRPEGERAYDLDVRFVPVKWGDRIYLVEENGLPGFAADAGRQLRSGANPFKDDFYVSDYVKRPKRDDPEMKSGPPILPERYEQFFEFGPSTAKVKSINPRGQVQIDQGKNKHLAVGQLLCVDRFLSNITVRVLSVSEHSAIGQPLYIYPQNEPIKVGQLLTTGSGWNRPMRSGARGYKRPQDVPTRKGS